MVERIDIERALDDLISNEEGMRFQGLAVALAQSRWRELVACERHNDLGLDAYASALNAPNGVGKGLACSITATFTKLNGDAKTAKEYYGSFSSLIFATPRKVTKDTEQEWAEKIRAEHGYELTVISREDIIATLQMPENAWMCRVHLGIPVPFVLPAGEILPRVREAAMEEASHWAAHRRLVGRPLIRLNAVTLDKSGSDTRDIVSTAQLRSSLARGGRFVLEAPAGRGKTTAIIQIAQAAGEGIPVLIDLPRWIRSGLDILDFIARIPAFRARSLDTAALARSPNDEPYLFLLNGWNEISSLHSQQAAEMLWEVAQQFPAAGILVATRVHHIVPPLPSLTRLRLLQLAPEQRFRYLVGAVGEDRARTVAATIATDPVLDDLTRTPFILSEVVTIFRAGQDIPKTKLALLHAVIGLMEQAEEHAPHLQGQPLWGRADNYLQALAVQLQARGDVVLAEAEARSLCHSVAAKLASAGQISVTPEPSEMLSALSSHHVLERLDYPGVSFRFEHQQFQEYYAARELRSVLDAAVAPGAGEKSDSFIRAYINLPSWEEPLRIIAEDLSTSENDIAAGQFLVRGSLRIDPVLAGTLFHLCAPPIQSASQADLDSRLRSLHDSSSPQYRQIALAGMLASGSASFRDILIPLLTADEQQTRLGVYRAGPDFQPSCLGEDWQQTVMQWNEQHRGEFVSELTMHQGRIEVGLAFVRTDPSRRIRLEALRSLIWAGQRGTATEILSAMPDDDFREAIQTFYPDELPISLRDRATQGYRALLASTSDPKLRLHFTLALAKFDDCETAARLKIELNALSPELVRELAEYQLRNAVDILRVADPQWLSDWVLGKAINGILCRDTWLSLILGIPEELQNQLLQRARAENLRSTPSQGVIAVLQATATRNLAKDVFSAVRDAQRELDADPQNQEKQDIEWQLKALLRNMSRSIVIEGLSEILAREPASEDLPIIAELFGQIGAPDSEPREPLPEPLRARVRAYFKAAVPVVLKQEDLRGELKAHLALGLARTGQLEDADDLVAVIRSDIQRLREGQAARMRGDHTKARQISMSWSPWHVQAIVILMGEKSEPILHGLLNEPEYEMDAASGLQVMASKAEPGPSAILAARNGPVALDYRKIRIAPDEWQASFRDGLRERAAAAVSQRIDTLLEESKAADPKKSLYPFRLKELAKVLATLDPHGSKDRILDILELPAQYDGWRRVALLERLIFAGVALPAEPILAALDPVIAELRRHGVHNDSASLFGHVLCVLPFLDPPARGIERIRELLSEFHIPLYAQRELLMAISQCRDEAGLSFLVDMARDNAGLFQQIGREWLDAVAACPLPRAKMVLLRFIDPEIDVALGDPVLSDHTIDLLAGRIANLARSDEKVQAKILDLTTKPPASDQQRVILAKAIASLDSPQALVAALNLIDDNAKQPLPYELWRAIEELFLEKRPYKTSSNSYTLVPRAAADIKRRLFEIVETDPKRSRTASNLLAQIEEWRLRYGRPASEPRHPLFDSGGIWPPN